MLDNEEQQQQATVVVYSTAITGSASSRCVDGLEGRTDSSFKLKQLKQRSGITALC